MEPMFLVDENTLGIVWVVDYDSTFVDAVTYTFRYPNMLDFFIRPRFSTE